MHVRLKGHSLTITKQMSIEIFDGSQLKKYAEVTSGSIATKVIQERVYYFDYYFYSSRSKK